MVGLVKAVLYCNTECLPPQQKIPSVSLLDGSMHSHNPLFREQALRKDETIMKIHMCVVNIVVPCILPLQAK